MTMNQKAKEEWEKKHAEAEKLRKQNDVSCGHFYLEISFTIQVFHNNQLFCAVGLMYKSMYVCI